MNFLGCTNKKNPVIELTKRRTGKGGGRVNQPKNQGCLEGPVTSIFGAGIGAYFHKKWLERKKV